MRHRAMRYFEWLLLQIEAIKLHHFDPGVNEVAHKLGARIAGGVHLGEGSQLRV
jgi:hypothetical protein